jgi:hypothetical protein
VEIRRSRRIGQEVGVEVSYGITSLARDRAGAARLLGLSRGHWGIENGLHHRRDVALREDASRIRKGHAAQLMAALRNLIVFLLPRAARQGLAGAMRHYMCHPHKAVELLSTRI